MKHIHFSERSQVLGQFCSHQFKCMSLLLHCACFGGSESSPDGGQIVNHINFRLYFVISGLVCEILIDSVDLKVLCIFCEVYLFFNIRGFQTLGRHCSVAT